MNRLPFIIILLITTFFLIFTATAEEDDPPPTPVPSSLGCDDKCGKRCAKSGYKERCLKYCGICCEKCQGCVPSTPYADKAECPCYRDLKNPKGKDKCP